MIPKSLLLVLILMCTAAAILPRGGTLCLSGRCLPAELEPVNNVEVQTEDSCCAGCTTSSTPIDSAPAVTESRGFEPCGCCFHPSSELPDRHEKPGLFQTCPLMTCNNPCAWSLDVNLVAAVLVPPPIVAPPPESFGKRRVSRLI